MINLTCPTCDKSITYSVENPYRPFCSERCKLIDLGDWAGENHSIKGKSAREEILSEELKSLLRKD